MQSLYNAIFGQPVPTQAQANSAFDSAYQQYNSQSALAGPSAQQQAAQYNQALMNSLMQQRTEWMIAGVPMTFDEFLNTLCPDADDPMRSFLTLKYAGRKTKT